MVTLYFKLMARLSLIGLLILLIFYILSPIDFIPDFIPFVGRIDDIVIPIILFWLYKKKFQRQSYKYSGGPSDENRNFGNENFKSAKSKKDPYNVLNIDRGSSEFEIKRAYKEMLSKYHPDKVAHLGKELQDLAHEKVIEITEAYNDIETRDFKN